MTGPFCFPKPEATGPRPTSEFLPASAPSLTVSPMSERLQHLRRQRALVAEHLAWLDREIDQALAGPTNPTLHPPAASPAPIDDLTSVPFSMRASAPASTPSVVQPGVISAKPAPANEAATDATADAILRDYRVEENTMKSDVKKGCLLYFFGALAVVGVGVVVLYFFFQRTR